MSTEAARSRALARAGRVWVIGRTRTGVPVLERGDQRQHQAGPVLVALLAAFEVLPVPEIRIAEDVADLDLSRQHACPSAVRY